MWQSYVLTLDASVDRDAVALSLREANIQANIGTYASHVQPVYGTTAPCPVSARLFAQHLAIPMHANLTDAEVDRVAAALKTALSAGPAKKEVSGG